MRAVANSRFNLKPVALALALAAGAVHAAPTPNQVPGGGIVAAVSLGSANVVGTPLVNLANGQILGVDGKVVIRWGGATAPPGETTNPLGFNIGANATFGFTGFSPNSAVLNIDASGNPSQIYGALVAYNAAGFYPAMFVSNANGIVVGPGGRIVAPAGVGLVGANLDNATSRNDFVGNNGWVIPAAPAYGNSYVSFGTVPSTGNVTIAGAINGDLALNKEAPYILVAGNNIDVLNTGNLFGKTVVLDAGLVAAPTAAAVGGISNVSVNRLFDVDAGLEAAYQLVGTLPGNLAVVPGVTGNVVNEGSISAVNGIVDREWITIQAKGNIRSGVLGDGNTQVGLFADRGIQINSYSDASKVELYNVVSGYTTNKSLLILGVNRYATYSGFAPDVTIDAITPGGQPSSISTQFGIIIWGGNVLINSTINHRTVADGGAQTDEGLIIAGSKSVTINADIGAAIDVEVRSGGPLTIAGNVMADGEGFPGGGIYVKNDGANAPTVISGDFTVPATSGDPIYIVGNGPVTVSGNLTNSGGDVVIGNEGKGSGNYTTVSGNVTAGAAVAILNVPSPAHTALTISGDVTADGVVLIGNGAAIPTGGGSGGDTTISGNVTSNFSTVSVAQYGTSPGKLTISGTLSAFMDVNIYSEGRTQLGAINAGDDILANVLGASLTIDGPWTAVTFIDLHSPLAMTKLTPDAVLTAPGVNLQGLSFTGVNASGATYANAGEKPAAQIVTNSLTVNLTGSINGPIAGTTNWLANSMDIAPLYTVGPVFVGVTANGGGFQAVNLRVLGDAIVDSGATRTPFIGVPLTTGGLPAGGLQGNLGSQLILQADGSMQVWGMPTGSLFGPPQAFQWPGGAVFKAGTTLQTFAPIYNAWSVASPPFGGVFFEAPYIALGGIVATSGTAWANFSTQPVTGDPVVYQIRQITPTTFGFEATTEFVKNVYSKTVTGGAPCVVTGPSTWTACP